MQREEIITLDQKDQDTLGAVLSKTTTTERVVRELREALNHGLEEVKDLRKAPSVTPGQARAARDALQTRAERIARVPAELVDPEVLATARAPVDAAIGVCDEILRYSTDNTTSESEGAPVAPNWGTVR